MKILKEERAIPQPTTEIVTTYELTQEEMYVLFVAAGLTSFTNRLGRMNPGQSRLVEDLYNDHIDTVRENQP